MQPPPHSPLKRKTMLKADHPADHVENPDEMLDNILREEDKNLKIQGVQYEKFKTAQPSCDCNICGLDLDYIRKNEEISKRPPFDPDYNPFDEKLIKPKGKIFNELEKDYVFILKRLQTVKPLNRSMGIMIPDTVAFQNSEAKFMISTQKQNRQFKFVKQKEKLTSHQIRKHFQERRSKPKETGNQEIVNLPREMVICKYADETTQILSEPEFINLITKRKQDASWKEIQYFQLYIRSKKSSYEVTKIPFEWSAEIKQEALYRRAQNDIAISNGDVAYSSSDFVSVEDEDAFQEKLKTGNFLDYCKYMFYKIHIFIEKFYSVLITKVYNEFLKDEAGYVYYINAFNLRYEELNKGFFLSEEFMTKMLNDPIIKEKERMKKQYEELQKSELQGLFAKVFYQDYEHLRNNTGLELHITKPEQTLNEETFNKIYPNTVYKLSELLSNSLSIDEIKKILNTGIASKQAKKTPFQNELFPRRKMYKTYTLPSLKSINKTNKSNEPSIFQTPVRSVASNFGQSQETFKDSNKSQRKKFHFVKSPAIKITYQVGSSLTDTHSIRIEGKLLERINAKNNLWRIKKKGMLDTLRMGSEYNSAQKSEKPEVKPKIAAPMICVHAVDFVFHGGF